MYEYAFRKWPLYASYRKLAAQFGADAAFYQQNLLFNSIFWLSAWVANFYAPVFYGFEAYSKDLRDLNMEAFLPSQKRSLIRVSLWMLCVLAVLCNAMFVEQEKKAYMHYRQPMRAFILAKLNYDTTRLDLDKSINTSEAAEIVRVVPKTFNILQKINILENEMYDRLAESDLVGNLKVSCGGRLFYVFGLKRDACYYKKYIEKQYARLNKLNKGKNTCAFIVSYNDEDVFRRALGQVKGKSFRVNGRKPKVISDILERNILIANLDYSNFSRGFRLMLTVLISIVVSAGLCAFLVFYRDVCRQWRDSSPNWFVYQIIYYSSYLIVIGFDQALRPILRWSATFEKFAFASSQERGFYFKYYVYQLINRFTIFISRSWDDGSPNLFTMVQLSTYWRKNTESIGMDLVNVFLIELFGYNAIDLFCSLFFKWYFSCNRTTEYGRQRYYNGQPIRYASLFTNFSVMYALLVGFAQFYPLIIPLFCAYCALQSFITRLRLLRLTSPPPVTDSLSSQYALNQYLNCILAVFMQYLSYGKPTIVSTVMFVIESAILASLALLIYVCVRCSCRKIAYRPSEESLLDERLVEEYLSLAERFNIVREKYNRYERTQLELQIK